VIAQCRPDAVTDGLAAKQNQSRGMATAEQAGVHQMVGIGGRHVDDVDAVFVAVGDQGGRITAQLLVAHVHLVPFDQPEQLLPRHVEGERDGVRNP
jgi:hypothetical protein